MLHLPPLDGANVVIVAPHPDDESLGTGGLVQTAVASGARVSIVMLTDGDCNPWPQRFIEQRWHIGDRERARWGMRRRVEAERALAVLGVATSDVHFINWPDMGITEHILADVAGTVETLAQLFDLLLREDSSSNVVVLPALVDRHPDHSAAHVLVRLAIARIGLSPCVLSYMVHGQADSAAIQLHLDDTSLRRKLDAVRQHRTQLVLSRDRMLRYAVRPERYSLDADIVSARVAPGHVLPWRIGIVTRRLADLLVVAPAGAWRVPLDRALSGAVQASNSPCITDRGGSLIVQLPKSLQSDGPIYAKLVSRIKSPWIYDYWGWSRST